MKLTLLFLAVVCLVGVHAFTRRLYAPDQPLFAKFVQAAKADAQGNTFGKVDGLGNFTSYAGFLHVNDAKDDNLFAWYFPAQNGNPKAPLLIWLQGGPGGASTFGLFSEIGPYSINDQMQLVPRPQTWNAQYSLLFIDNPVGAGFSYTGAGIYNTNQSTIAEDLYAAMQLFYQYFPYQRTNDLYITGESFAGHYIPAFGAKIHSANAEAPPEQQIPLKGVSIGDGWTDPLIQLTAYPDIVFGFGMASQEQRDQIEVYTDNAVAAIREGNLREAFLQWDIMMNGDIYPYPTYFYNVTGSKNYDNFLTLQEPASFGYFSQYLNQDAVRQAIHVGNATFNDGHACEMNLVEDVMRSYKSDLATLLDNNYKVLLYNGQLDIIVGAILTERYLPTIPWAGAHGFSATPRSIWRPTQGDPNIYGYVQQYENLVYAVIRNAGHIAPYDQPEASLDLITRFVNNLPFPGN